MFRSYLPWRCRLQGLFTITLSTSINRGKGVVNFLVLFLYPSGGIQGDD